MNVFEILSMVGGIALFLYGMKLMGDSLSKMAGGRLAVILESLTSSRIKAVLLGTAVTAIIQSSSATTVMVVGFVNSGIMNLGQAVGVIMGANIGTTITSWMLSLAGIQGESVLLQMLKPSSFAPLVAIIGIFFLMTVKENDKKEGIGSIMLGFAILMFGMETMSDAVAPLAENEKFAELMLAFSNPILGVVAGAVITAIIQSSTASVGILQAFSLTGAVSFNTAIPIILGQNIGTCGTAMISAIGASKNAKKAALIHLNFNIIGTMIFLVLFYVANMFIGFDFLTNQINPAEIAMIHSLFNIGCTIFLYPFANMIVTLTDKIIPDEVSVSSAASSHVFLDERFLKRPGFALEISRKATSNMAQEVNIVLNEALSLIELGYDKNRARLVKNYEDHIDEYRDKISDYLLKLSRKDLSSADAEKLVIMQHAIKDLEDISDYARGIQKEAKKIKKKQLVFDDKTRAEFDEIIKMTINIVEIANSMLVSNDVHMIDKIELLEEKIHASKKGLKKLFLRKIRIGEIELELGIIFEDILIKLDRIAAHCTNIAYTLVEVEG